ncbi:MAG: 2-hydroxyacyl-CoA dehydratase family protein [Thermodesulfobacteriota bacterium]|nr:2-hydroxyacyl-CoA dehydratase family protein [Thermodesulfobacteriota bacterium]
MSKETKALPLESWGMIKNLNNSHIARIIKAREEGKRVAFHTAFFPSELVAAFDLVSVPGEWYGSMCGFDRERAMDLHDITERSGFPGDSCSYTRVSLGSAIANSSFMGMFPEPDIVFGIEGECNFQVKWFEAMARYFNVPFFPMDSASCQSYDLPGWGEDSQRDAINYLLSQVRRFVEFMEKFTGKKLEEDKLLKVVDLAHKNLFLWSDVLDLAMAKPSPITIRSLFTFENTVISLLCEQGTTDVLSTLRDELTERIKQGIPGLPDERIRLLWDCQPPWYDLNLFRYFESRGANFVVSPYLGEFGGRHWARYCDEEVGKWLRTRKTPTNFEEGLWEIARLHTSRHARPRLPALVREAVEQSREAQVDGAVFHYVRGCKLVPYGIYDKKNAVSEALGIPSMILESSTADPRAYSEVQIRNQVDIFLEQITDLKKE